MVDTMGRISAVYRGDGAFVAGVGNADPGIGLRRDGALAGLDRNSSDWLGNIPTLQATAGDSHRHLARLLGPLHERPEQLAERLLHRFGSIGRIAQASDNELRCTAIKGEAWIEAFLMVRRLMHDGLREELTRTRLGEDRRALCAYLLSTMQGLQDERMVAIFADDSGFVIAEETISEGASNHLLLTPRRIFGRAMKLDAGRILLAHNHPSGSAEPSETDIRNTRALARQARTLSLRLDDHLIVGSREVVSMKDRGLF